MITIVKINHCLYISFFSLFMSMEWLLRFVTWKSSVKGVLARRSEPWRPPEKYAFGKRLRASFLPLTLGDLTRFCGASCGRLPRSWSTRGWFPFIPWNHFLGAYLPCHPAMRSRPSRYAVSFAQPWPRGLPWLRAPAKGGSGGMKGSGFVQLRCMEVYRGYSRYWSDSIWGSINGCLWRLWIDLPINCWVEVCTFFSCDCAADSVQWSFEVILSDIRSLNESYRLSQTDPGFDHPENPEWGELALSWYASVSERVGKSSEPILSGKDDPVARLIKTIRLPQKTSINFYKP